MKIILNELSKSLKTSFEVYKILGNPKEYPTELIENLSIETALKFYHKEISYIQGDYIMNNIYGFWIHYFCEDFGFSEIAHECYEAFDAGEYYRPKDDSKLDPSEIYTRPLIVEFLKKIKKI